MFCRIRGVEMHYEEVGSGRPLFVLHGWDFNGAMALASSEPLIGNPAGWRRIYPDLPGHGRTPIPTSVRNHDDVLDMLLEFIETIAPGERFAILGWSWGGYLALGVTHHRGSRLDGVALAIPSITWGRPHVAPAHRIVRRDPEFADALRPGEQWMTEDVASQSLALLMEVRKAGFAEALPQESAMFRLLDQTPFSFDPRQLPEPLHSPALIVTGRQDHIVGFEEQWAMLDRFPRATFAVLDSAGHFLIYEQSALASALLQEWLERVEDHSDPRHRVV